LSRLIAHFSAGLNSQNKHCCHRQWMETEMQKTQPRITQKALTVFMARKAEIDSRLARLKALSADHFKVSPDDVNWGHVGDLARYAELLRQITDAAFKEGEHVG
jgi:hypothetical protein